MTPSIIKLILILGYIVVYVQGALVTSYQCSNVDQSDFKLAPFIIDVALDEDDKLLKFFINSKVLGLSSIPDDDVIISDVNSSTNKYTTMHVDIKFMGKVFVDEDIRFCDSLAVKHTEELWTSPRYTSSSERVISDTGIDDIVSRQETKGNDGKVQRSDSIEDESISLSTSNKTVENYFSNSTGNLIQCPLYANDSIVIYYEVDISDHYQKLGSYTVNFKVFANDDSSQIIRCNKAYVTPEHSDILQRVLTISVPVLLLLTGLINFFTVIYSSYQESSNPFLFVASTICNDNLLKQLDATVEQIITYFQFALFIGGLDLQYPGFYQPLIGQIRWCALMGFVFIQDSKENSVERDNIYVTLNLNGLKNLATYSSDLTYGSCWTNFIITFVIWTMILIAAHHLFLTMRCLFLFIYRKLRRGNPNYEEKRPTSNSIPRQNYEFTIKMNFYHILGQILQNFIVLFGFPFLVLTTFMLLDASTLRHLKYIPVKENIKNNIFSTSVPYEKIFSPNLFVMIESLSDVIGSQANHVHTLNSTDPSFNNDTTAYVRESGKYVKVPVSSITIGSILLALWIGLVMFFVFNYLITIKNWGIRPNKKLSHLYTSMKSILMWGYCYCKYHPDKVYFVTIDLLGLLLKLLVIGCLQSFGSVQVALLIVIEGLSVILLFAIRPYFVRLTWLTTRWILPMAKFLVTILCIPYIKSLELSELTRTYVAFIQLTIHVIVAIIFTIHLVYCLTITMLSIIRERRNKLRYEKGVGNHAYNSIDEFNTHFEYHPVANPIPSFAPHNNEFKAIKGSHINSFNFPHGLDNNEIEETCIDAEDDDPYYRAGSEKQLRKIHHEPIDEIVYGKIPTTRSNVNFAKTNDTESMVGSLLNSGTQSVISFEQQQVFSNIRKRNNDYTFREGDLIYKKYFTDDSIDPEIKELWASRNNWNLCHSPNSKDKIQQENKIHNVKKQVSNDSETFSLSSLHLFSDVKNFLLFRTSLQRKNDVQSFLVSRPKKLVVKSYSSVNNNLEPDYPSLSGYSSPSTPTLAEK